MPLLSSNWILRNRSSTNWPPPFLASPGLSILSEWWILSYFLITCYHLSRCFNYMAWKTTYLIFASVFIITWLVSLPFWLLNLGVLNETRSFSPFLLLVSQWGWQRLWLSWAYFILHMAHKFLMRKLVEDEKAQRRKRRVQLRQNQRADPTNGHPSSIKILRVPERWLRN